MDIIEPKEKCFIVLSDGRKTQVDSIYTTRSDLNDRLCRTFTLQRTDIVNIFHGYPAQKFANDDDLRKLPSVIFVQLKEKPANQTGTSQSNRITSILRLYGLANVYEAFLGTPFFWTYLEENPILFQKNGIIYNYLKITGDGKLVDNRHYRLPYFLDKQVLAYNEKTDCIELCIPCVKHVQINPRLSEDFTTIEYFLNELCVERINIVGTPTDFSLLTPFSVYCSKLF